jgi:hypothetical protein
LTVLRGPLHGSAPVGPALDALAAGGAQGIMRLLDLATDAAEQPAWLGVEGLARCAPPTPGLALALQSIFADALHGERAALRRAAAWGLTLHPRSPVGVDALMTALDDPDPLTRILAARAVGPVDPDRLWLALGPLFEGDAATRAGAYRAAGVLEVAAAAPWLADAVELEERALSRTALTAWARVDAHAAIERARTHPDGVWALIDAPVRLPAELADGIDSDLADRPASPLDPGRHLPWPRTHRRLLAPIALHPADGATLANLATVADGAKVEAGVRFCCLRIGQAPPSDARVAHLVAMSVDNRYRAPAHADRAPEIAPSPRALQSWLTASQSCGSLATASSEEPECVS